MINSFLRRFTRVFHIDDQRQATVTEQVKGGSEGDVDFFTTTALSGIIVALGLIIDSAAVVIGAMLIAPFFWPILNMSIAVIKGNPRKLKKSILLLAQASILVLIVSFLIGIISPFKESTFEIISRTQPTLIDLFIALAAGLIGAFIVSWPRITSNLAGVVVAAALLPPLGVVGISLAFLNFEQALGALLLYFANLIAVTLSATLMFLLMDFKPPKSETGQKRMKNEIIWVISFFIVVALPLTFIMRKIILDNTWKDLAEQSIMAISSDSKVTEIEINDQKKEINIIATVQSSENFTEDQVNELTSILSEALNRSIKLKIFIVPTIEAGKTFNGFNNNSY